ncbi:hypothetical protein ENBRE01_0144 [Enteropsectra breve]|nr:hypothetical protein ENBRE01_0144 [Enteropsectra breve]
MEPVLNKMRKFGQIFSANIRKEYQENKEFKKDVDRFVIPAKRAHDLLQPLAASASAALSSAYIDIKKAESKFKQNFYPEPWFTSSKVDEFLEKSIAIPQYYGGIKKDYSDEERYDVFKRILSFASNVPILNKISKYFGDSKVYNDYKVLTRLENVVVPRIIVDFFNYQENEDTTQEALDSLKALRDSLIRPNMHDIQMHPIDIRQTQIDSVDMKNLKKIIRISFEATIRVTGKIDGIFITENQNIGGSFEFARVNRKWTATSFSYSRL